MIQAQTVLLGQTALLGPVFCALTWLAVRVYRWVARHLRRRWDGPAGVREPRTGPVPAHPDGHRHPHPMELTPPTLPPPTRPALTRPTQPQQTPAPQVARALPASPIRRRHTNGSAGTRFTRGRAASLPPVPAPAT